TRQCIGTKEEHSTEQAVIPAMTAAPAQINALREQIRRIEAADRTSRGVLPFGVPEIDRRLPGGGLALGALHEIAGGAHGALDGAAAALFVAGVLARTHPPARLCGRARGRLVPPRARD